MKENIKQSIELSCLKFTYFTYELLFILSSIFIGPLLCTKSYAFALLSQFYRWENWGLRSLNNLPKVTKPWQS